MWQTMMAEPDTAVAELKEQASVAAMAKMMSLDIKAKVSGQLPGCLNIFGGDIVVALCVLLLGEHVASPEQLGFVLMNGGGIVTGCLH
jgi:hypothetical protein